MSDYSRCPKCGQYDFMRDHWCTSFLVWFPEHYGEEWEVIYGKTMEGVVEKIARDINQDDPVFEENVFEMPITIKDSSGIMKSFQCTAEINVDYFPKEVLLDNEFMEDNQE